MSYRAFGISIALAVVWTVAFLYAIRPAPYAPLNYYEAHTSSDSYRIQAHEVRQDGFCSVFIRDEQRIAAVCGAHVWSEAVEVE